ncbi:CASTOR/POLLUX-related putative ion channel [Streptomyces sp. 4F14]|uniref:CASTOR/POLLUX-related putative ion channel n=1 Tax=Streptomyces sp. 4F14 TaxID=3394380 RepID=UPI003A836ADB
MERRQGRTHLHHRVRYLFDRTLARSTGTLLGWLALSCLAIVVPVSALLVWTDPDAPRSLSGRLIQVGRTSAETLRLGAATGAPVRMLLSVILGLIALLCVSTVIGVVTTGLGDRLTELRRGRSRVLEQGHTVVLGWSDQIFPLVAELVAARPVGVRHVVTVLADRDPAVMERELAVVVGSAGGVRLECRSGAPADPDALALVMPGTARTVTVLPVEDGEGAENADGDLMVVRTLLALRTLLPAEGGPRVVAAVHDGRHLPAARLAAGPRGTVLETDRTTARLLLQSAGHPGMSSVVRDLLDFSGAEFHVGEVPRTAGTTFEDVALRLETACAVGLVRPDGTLSLTPAPGTVLGPGDRLVTVAHDDVPVPLDDRCAEVDVSAVVPPRPWPEPPARLLLLGWNRRAPLMVDILRRTARPGSVLDVVAGPATDVPSYRDSSALSVVHRAGDPAAPETFGGLDLDVYDSVVVLGADRGARPERSDDRTLLSMLILRSREERTRRVLPVVAEMRDHRSGRIAPLGAASDVVLRGELTALLMAQIVHDPELAAVFEEIFAVRGGALALRAADHYVVSGREVSFATVVAAALRRGECAIGYRAHDPYAHRPYASVRLCPGKSERRVWNAGDELLVLTAGRVQADPERRPVPGMRAEHGEEGDAPPSAPEAGIPF